MSANAAQRTRTREKFHLERGANELTNLEKILSNQKGSLSSEERKNAVIIYSDLFSAYGNNDPNQFKENNVPPQTQGGHSTTARKDSADVHWQEIREEIGGYPFLDTSCSTRYLTTQRDDTPFWNTFKNEVPASDSVAQFLESYSGQAPHLSCEMYPLKAFFGMLTSRGVLPKHDVPLLDHMDLEPPFRMIRSRLSHNRSIPTEALSHADFIAAVAGDA